MRRDLYCEECGAEDHVSADCWIAVIWLNAEDSASPNWREGAD